MATFSTKDTLVDKLIRSGAKLGLSDEAFEAAAKNADRELIENPGLHSLKVKLLGSSVYFFIAAVLLTYSVMTLAIIGFLFSHHASVLGAKLSLILIVPIVVIFKSLFVKITPPPGFEIKRAEAPQLFSLIDEISSRLRTPVHKVFYTADMNAMVTQIPRLGFLGWHKNYLYVGLPLMLTQRPDYFKAVLSHELGHLSGNHSKSNAWVYKLSMRFDNLINNLQDGILGLPFLLYFFWVTPRFNALTFSIKRKHELEADLNATEIAGKDNFINSMLSLPQESVIENIFWEELVDTRKTVPQAPDDVYHRFAAYLGNQDLEAVPKGHDKSVRTQIFDSLKDALADKGSGYDTHPPLKTRVCNGLFASDLQLTDEGLPTEDRLRTLLAPMSSEQSAARAFLGSHMETTLSRLSEQWLQNISESWVNDYEYYQEQHKRLEELEVEIAKLDEQKPLAERIELLREKAAAIARLHDLKRARPVYEQILELDQIDVNANYVVGRIKLDEDDDDGIIHLERAASKKILLQPEICMIAASYLEKRKKPQEAKAYTERREEFHKRFEASANERSKINEKCTFETHDLSKHDIEVLHSFFSHAPDLYRKVQFVKMHLHTFPEYPFYVLAVELQPKYGKDEDRTGVASVIRQSLGMASDYTLVMHDMFTRKLLNKLDEIPNSAIYP